jgi:hypothetical protein
MEPSKVFNIINMYPFVKTEYARNSKDFIDQRLKEYQLMVKLRSAVSFCKKINGIKSADVTKLTNEEKEGIENCLRENFLKSDPNYFGVRDVIYLDLHNYQ